MHTITYPGISTCRQCVCREWVVLSGERQRVPHRYSRRLQASVLLHAVQAGLATEARAVRRARQLPHNADQRPLSRRAPGELLPAVPVVRTSGETRSSGAGNCGMKARAARARLFHMGIQRRKTAHHRHASIQGPMYRRSGGNWVSNFEFNVYMTARECNYGTDGARWAAACVTCRIVRGTSTTRLGCDGALGMARSRGLQLSARGRLSPRLWRRVERSVFAFI